MYTPPEFAEEDRQTLVALMRAHGFATLVTVPGGAIQVSHLPFLVEETDGGDLVLHAHMARANPQWRDFQDLDSALVIFQGPHAYVSPNWYVNAGLVPTWNYTVVHATGRPRLVDDPGAARGHLERLVATHEADFEVPWSLDSLDAASVDAMLGAIVPFAMPVDALHGKFKLNQNRKAEDRAGALAGLRAAGDPLSTAVAALMTRRAAAG